MKRLATARTDSGSLALPHLLRLPAYLPHAIGLCALATEHILAFSLASLASL